MRRLIEAVKAPQNLGLLCAGGAVGLGLVYLLVAGASARHIAINCAALMVGFAAYATVTWPTWRLGAAGKAVLPGLALALLATALLAPAVEGAARWVSVGPLSLQVSLILLPAMVVAFARAPDAAGAGAMGLAALALALQPDRGMAGVLAASLAALAVRRPGTPVLAALGAAVLGFAATLVQPDMLPPVPFVDQILFTAFSVDPLAGLAVLAGAGLLVLPALAARSGGERRVALVFGTLWVAVVLAAALGNYPTPLVGYGGSAIVGYLLSLAVLAEGASRVSARKRVGAPGGGSDGARLSRAASPA